MQISDICKHLQKIDSSILLEEDTNYLLIDPSKWNEISNELASNKKLSFDYLMCISSIDLENDQLALAYNLHSTETKKSIEFNLVFPKDAQIPSVESLWKTANWHEREAYDLMGILFEGHPDMKRILLPEDWEGHPLRKDWKEPEYYNGMPVPKDKSYWE